MSCTECNNTDGRPVLVTFSTGKTEELTLCEPCREEYRNGGLVTEVSTERPETGGISETVARCADCGEIYPAQRSSENDLRPVGLEDGTCVCGNAEFRPLAAK